MRGRFVPVGTLVLSLLGLAVSIYLTIDHYSEATTLICPANTSVDCAKVTESPQSAFLGIPVAVLGVAYFVALILLCLPASWRAGRGVALGRLAVAGAGVAFVAWLVYAEIALIGAICLWCTVVHVITVVIFLMLLFDWAGGVEEEAGD